MTREAYRHAERIRLESQDSIRAARPRPEVIPPAWALLLFQVIAGLLVYAAVSLAWHLLKRRTGL